MVKRTFLACTDCQTRPSGVFSDVPEEILNEFDKTKVINTYKKGQVLFYEGNKPFGIYCLNQGKIKLYKTTSDGKEYITQLSKMGDILGYRSFFTDETYGATAQVLENATVCFIDRDKFYDLVKKHPPFSSKLIKLLSDEVKCSHQKAVSLAYKSCNERIVETILTLNQVYGVSLDDNSSKIDLSLSREELANMVGTTVETIVRFLTSLKEKDVISIKNKYIYINDIKKLSELLPE